MVSDQERDYALSVQISLMLFEKNPSYKILSITRTRYFRNLNPAF